MRCLGPPPASRTGCAACSGACGTSGLHSAGLARWTQGHRTACAPPRSPAHIQRQGPACSPRKGAIVTAGTWEQSLAVGAWLAAAHVRAASATGLCKQQIYTGVSHFMQSKPHPHNVLSRLCLSRATTTYSVEAPACSPHTNCSAGKSMSWVQEAKPPKTLQHEAAGH